MVGGEELQSSDALTTGLLSIANGCVESYGHVFHEDVQAAITELIEGAVSRLNKSDLTSIQTVQQNLLLIISLMVRESDKGALTSGNRIRGSAWVFNPDGSTSIIITMDIFSRIKKLLCPLPPIWEAPCN